MLSKSLIYLYLNKYISIYEYFFIIFQETNSYGRNQYLKKKKYIYIYIYIFVIKLSKNYDNKFFFFHHLNSKKKKLNNNK